ncbi:MAG: hypothetical protein AEth_00496, partial [Candidatus Argoarchaeum ethanivorans]
EWKNESDKRKLLEDLVLVQLTKEMESVLSFDWRVKMGKSKYSIMFYKNFHFYSSGSNKDKNTMHSIGVNSDSMFDFIQLH